jgi:hypothetical protein
VCIIEGEGGVEGDAPSESSSFWRVISSNNTNGLVCTGGYRIPESDVMVLNGSGDGIQRMTLMVLEKSMVTTV